MVTARDAGWTVRVVTLVLWMGAAASAVAWGLKFAGNAAGPAVATAGVRQPTTDTAAVARVLGPGAAAPQAVAVAPVASRYQLVGVVADASSRGAALIAIDGRPAKPFRVGATVDDGVVLQAVAPRRAVLANPSSGATVATLDMPLPTPTQR